MDLYIYSYIYSISSIIALATLFFFDLLQLTYVTINIWQALRPFPRVLISPKELYKDLVTDGTKAQAFARFDRGPLVHVNNSLVSCATTVPSIDMHGLMASQQGTSTHLNHLHSACHNSGLFFLRNHEVDPSILGKVKLEIEEFFKLPFEDKLMFRIRPGESQGYGHRITSESKLDWSDRFYMFVNPLSLRKPHLFPMLPLSLREALEAYMKELQKLAMKILGMMARALNMEEQEMVELFEDGMQSVRMTYYPPHPEPERVLGITPHSDATGITILLQLNQVGGLEINKDGNWIPVEAPPGDFIVNVGDVMEMVSNGKYKSVEHRVIVNQDKERMSIAMFFNPKLEKKVGPSRSLISPNTPPLFKTVSMQQYVEDYFTTSLDGKSYLDRMRV